MSLSGVHAVVLNYCQFQETIGCVEALVDSGLPGAQILVVDNASPDGSGRALEENLRGPGLLRLPRNGGYGAGNNAGIEALWGRPGPAPSHVFIVNPDVRVRSGTLEAVLESLSGVRRGGATCVQYDPASPRHLDGHFRAWIENRGLDVAALERRSFIPLDSLLGAAMMLTRDAIEQVGGFDPLYFMYAEEEDLARRLRYHGFEIGLATRARVVHGRTYLAPGARDEGRRFERRTSQYLFRLKDPFPPLAFNVARVLRFAASNLRDVATIREAGFKEWYREIVWVSGRTLGALRHRRLERRGRAHVDLKGRVGRPR